VCRRFLIAITFILACACFTADTVGVVSQISVVSDKAENVSTLEAWKSAYIKPGMSDQDKAIAIYKTVVKYRHQATPVTEGNQYECTHDPMKTMHVYGYGICCCASSNVLGLARYLGLPARGRALNPHVISEIGYDNGWHLFDGSLLCYFTKKDGKVASVDDIREAVSSWTQQNAGFHRNEQKLRDFAKNGGWKKGPELLRECSTYDTNGVNCAGWHGWATTMHLFDVPNSPEYEFGPSLGYQVNIQLRRGEKLTRNWFNHGLFLNMPDQNPGNILKDRVGLGTQRELGDLAPARVGNGVLEYNVPLASGVFRSGALLADNLAATSEDKRSPAVHVKDAAKPGVLIIRMPCSYVYLTGEAKLKAAIGAKGAIAISISDTQGRSWKPVTTISASGEQTIDLKPFCYRKYDYRLKLELSGEGTGLDALKISHIFQHSQAPLPIIVEGDNKITFTAGQEGTITLEPQMNPDGAAKWGQPSYLDFNPVINGLGKPFLTGSGDATFTVNTPGDLARLRMSFFYRARDGRDAYEVMVSYDGGKTFKSVEKLTGPTAGTTKYITVSDVPKGVRETLVKLVGTQSTANCLFDLRIDADYKEPQGGFKPVKITYAWEEGGTAKTHEFIAKKPSETYSIKCGPKTLAKSVTVELAE